MKKYPAIALVEFGDIAKGVYTTDAIIKKASISVLKCGTISSGRYLALFGGSTGAVDESYREGLEVGQDSIIDHVFLPDIHPVVHDGLLGKRARKGWAGSMAIIETPTIACNVRAAELALKGTPVGLVEIRLADSWLAGKGVSFYFGDLHDIQAAVDIAVGALKDSHVDVLYQIVTSPHEALSQQVAHTTHFEVSELMELDGEVV